MSSEINIGLAQINVTVGAIEKNVDQIIQFADRARDELACNLMVCSELVLTGYPPEDLLMRPGFNTRVQSQLARLCEAVSGIDLVVGYPKKTSAGLFNMCALIADGKIVQEYAKIKLPNYSVFDEVRYFAAGESAVVVDYRGIKLGLTVCEDIWHDGPIEAAVAEGAELIININGSPYHANKIPERRSVVCARSKATKTPVIYVNQVGGQDELVFDGASFVTDQQGEVVHQMASFEAALSKVAVTRHGAVVTVTGSEMIAQQPRLESIYNALVLGVRDYVQKNGFSGVVIGLSGGIDSALTTTIAVDALGKENVDVIMMPFRYTSDISKEDAHLEAAALGITYHVVSIEPMYDAIVQQVAPLFNGAEADTTEENIQARCRGLTLMAYSNKTGKMVLTTGNKSEMSVGYATLYGDMVGGYNAIKDVPKTLVYELAGYRNSVSPVIPERVITREPSAELRPDQIDTDSLPPYDILDPILELYVEQDCPPADIVARGFAREYVEQVIRMVDRNEYKRRQAAPGVRITKRAFGRDRRYPITSGFRPQVDW
ncbi:NAD+ synthase [Arenicella chitinivorans]|uniref:Glutamine-dependent NAD(+) synthetase n=1 Tax=Arenicella chitinivorans TaxID=1329800 RepID=A0A918RZR4_9GAMM|nr:NAD+ synthase [Arenicella chitinivorans]GHA17234.1 NAD+ synthase [Arenicella chitinivorans]